MNLNVTIILCSNTYWIYFEVSTELCPSAFIDKSVVPESVHDMKVIHGGKVIENGKTLADSGLHVGGEVITMHVVVQPSVAKQKKGIICINLLYALP